MMAVQDSLVPEGVSVAVTTYKRREPLRACIESIVSNDFRPIEIVVSDNSYSEESRAIVNSVPLPEGVTLRHFPGPGTYPSSARAAFEACSHDLVMLLHDDDFLSPHGLDRLLEAWIAHGGNLDAVYGRQYITDANGRIKPDATARSNQYYKKMGPSGVQPSPLWCALVGQFPNDAMLIRRSLAVAAQYPLESEVGIKPADCHFAMRYAKLSTRPFVLIEDYVSAFRLSNISLSRSKPKFDGHIGFEALCRVETSTPFEEEAKAMAKDRFAAAAIMGYLSDGETAKAARLLREHGMRLDKNWLIRIGLVGLVAAASIGLPLPIHRGTRRSDA